MGPACGVEQKAEYGKATIIFSDSKGVEMSQKELDNIKTFFEGLNIAYELVEHAPVRTAEEAAAARKSEVADGVKAMILECKRGERQFVVCADLPANRKLDLKKIKAVLQADDVRLCALDKVESLTGCGPGGVPPLGHTPKIPVLVDKAVLLRTQSAFNAGLNTVSIKLATADLKKAFEAYGAAFFEFSE